MKATVHPLTNATMYDLVSTQLYLDNPEIFDVLENIVIMAIIPIFTFVVVVVATSATVVQLKRVIVWRQRASAKVDGTEVRRQPCWCGCCVVQSCNDSHLYFFFSRLFSPSVKVVSLTSNHIIMSPSSLNKTKTVLHFRQHSSA